MTKLKPYPEYQGIAVPWLEKAPTNWSLQALRYLAIVETGTKDTIDSVPSGSYPFVVRSKTLLSIDSFTYDTEAILTAGDGDVGEVFHHLTGKFDVHQRVYVLRNFRNILPRFLYYYFSSQFKRVVAYGGALTTVASLRRPMFTSFPVLVPSRDEQLVICAFLDRETAEIDAFIADQEELSGLLAERRAATINRAVTAGVGTSVRSRPGGTSWLGEVPSTWEIRPLWSMFSRIKDVGHPEEPMLSVFREFGVVYKDSYANLNKTAENRNIYQLVGPGWLVANRMKAWQGSVGISSLRGIVSGHYICFKPRHQESSEYLNYLFRSQAYAAGYATLSRGVRIGQAEIDNDLYRLLPVLIPPRAEQEHIVAAIRRETAELDTAIADAREAIVLSKERRAALISAAVTGKMDVRGAA
jgi:type I restriction enzyme S subunit